MSTKVISTIGKRTAIALAVASAFTNASAFAQETPKATEVITVTGMLSSLKASMLDKKESNVVSDGISAEDLGKFPDLNVAESLQRITGVSIDRSGGEGQAVTVRGFGPQFNTVLVNGRQLATDSAGREFNFDVLAADQITGADVFKTTSANLQEGGIGGTINVSTARPFDYEGFQVVGSLKGMYESLSEETSPAASLLISNTFNEDRLGVLLAVSHSERDVQINRIETAGWRPGQTISNDADGDGEANVLFTNAYIPRNWDQIVDKQERTRTNASLVLQYAPTDEIEITVDGYMSKFEVKSEVTDLASWFEPDRVDSATIDAATGTLTSFNQGIGFWDVSNVTNMDVMFFGASKFNKEIGDWNTSKVTQMLSLFMDASAFNQDIGNWDTSNVSEMTSMFRGASSFNQNLSNWCVINIFTEPNSFAFNSAMKKVNKPIWGDCP